MASPTGQRTIDAVTAAPFTEAPFDVRAALAECRALADTAAAAGNSPIAAVAVETTGRIIARAANNQWVTGDVTEHAERRLISELAAQHVDISDLWVVSNAEPCSMCASALIKAKVAGIAYGAPAETSMDPWLPLAAVIAASTHQPAIDAAIDVDLHTEHIRNGRATAAAAREHAHRTAALAALTNWLETGGHDGTALTLDDWSVSTHRDAVVFATPPPARSNRLYLVRGDHVSAFAPSHTTIDEAYDALQQP